MEVRILADFSFPISSFLAESQPLSNHSDMAQTGGTQPENLAVTGESAKASATFRDNILDS
jgi:hypothetical protein